MNCFKYGPDHVPLSFSHVSLLLSLVHPDGGCIALLSFNYVSLLLSFVHSDEDLKVLISVSLLFNWEYALQVAYILLT